MISKNSKNTEKGFTLVELAVVLIISGLIVSVFVSAYLRWKDILQATHTEENMAVVADAVSAFVSLNYRIPCPANPANDGPEPFGTELGSDRQPPGGDGVVDDIGNCPAAAQWEGIVPFATLGLDASFARDGWGNYYTYKVNPDFTADLDLKTIAIHAKCRTTDWIEGALYDGTILQGGRNLNHRKANFCCRQSSPENRLEIYSNLASATSSIIYREDGASWYAPADNIADPYDTNANNPLNNAAGAPAYGEVLYGGGISDNSAAGNPAYGYTDMVTYALISHGKDGEGVFLDGGGRSRVDQGTAQEINGKTNDADGNGGGGADGIEDQAIYDLPHNSSNGANYYDDIVQFQTQSNIMARLRRGSCALP